MKTSISSWLLASAPMPFAGLSRSRRMVDAGRGATVSAIRLTRRARLRGEIRAAVDARDPRQQIIHFGFRGVRDRGTRLALRAGGDDAALLQHIFAHCQARAGLLLISDQRQMRVEQVVRGVALA